MLGSIQKVRNHFLKKENSESSELLSDEIIKRTYSELPKVFNKIIVSHGRGLGGLVGARRGYSSYSAWAGVWVPGGAGLNTSEVLDLSTETISTGNNATASRTSGGNSNDLTGNSGYTYGGITMGGNVAKTNGATKCNTNTNTYSEVNLCNIISNMTVGSFHGRDKAWWQKSDGNLGVQTKHVYSSDTESISSLFNTSSIDNESQAMMGNYETFSYYKNKNDLQKINIVTEIASVIDTNNVQSIGGQGFSSWLDRVITPAFGVNNKEAFTFFFAVDLFYSSGLLKQLGGNLSTASALNGYIMGGYDKDYSKSTTKLNHMLGNQVTLLPDLSNFRSAGSAFSF